MGDVIPGISEVLTFSGGLFSVYLFAFLGVFIIRALARQPEGAWLYYMSSFFSPLQAVREVPRRLLGCLCSAA